MPKEVIGSLNQAIRSLGVTADQAASRRPPSPDPNKFRVGDNYRQQKGQASGYLKRSSVEQYADILLNLLRGAAYDREADAKIVNDTPSKATFDKLRETPSPPGLIGDRNRSPTRECSSQAKQYWNSRQRLAEWPGRPSHACQPLNSTTSSTNSCRSEPSHPEFERSSHSYPHHY
ncbi:hypothetical protein FGIG_11030 [Fasciola gigantica]|uniref:Uncharacterized protein n=1 Tax=Fasciola gigantica TaxID=46835 RepID=A0A504YVL6_FASGI|nr:hypothetical protein FGIG_11030 [Fasciola gigantica]